MKANENTMKTFHDKMKASEKNKVYHSVLYQYLDVFMFSFEFAGTLQGLKTLAWQALKAYNSS